MSGWPTRDRRWEWDRRSLEDRRQASERRGDVNRREFGGSAGTTQDTVRTYVFRSFSERRRGNGGRAFPVLDRRAPEDRRAQADPTENDGTVDLSPEEILALLHHPEE